MKICVSVQIYMDLTLTIIFLNVNFSYVMVLLLIFKIQENLSSPCKCKIAGAPSPLFRRGQSFKRESMETPMLVCASQKTQHVYCLFGTDKQHQQENSKDCCFSIRAVFMLIG